MVNDNVLNVFIRFSVDTFLISMLCGAGSYSTHFQHAVHRAERIRAAIGIVSGYVWGARFAAPLPIHHEFVFVAARWERHGAGPLALRQMVVQWCGVWLPIVEGAGDEHRLRFRRVAGQMNFLNVTVRLGVAARLTGFILLHGFVFCIVHGHNFSFLSFVFVCFCSGEQRVRKIHFRLRSPDS